MIDIMHNVAITTFLSKQVRKTERSGDSFFSNIKGREISAFTGKELTFAMERS
jgi:hypothetical protein